MLKVSRDTSPISLCFEEICPEMWWKSREKRTRDKESKQLAQRQVSFITCCICNKLEKDRPVLFSLRFIHSFPCAQIMYV